MGGKSRDVTEAELAILQVLWERGSCSVRELIEQLYPNAGPSAPSTVQTLLQRLERKGCVRRESDSTAHRFFASISRDNLIDRRLRAVAEELCGGSLGSLLSHLVQVNRLSPKEQEDLREHLNQLRREQPPKRSRG